MVTGHFSQAFQKLWSYFLEVFFHFSVAGQQTTPKHSGLKLQFIIVFHDSVYWQGSPGKLLCEAPWLLWADGKCTSSHQKVLLVRCQRCLTLVAGSWYGLGLTDTLWSVLQLEYLYMGCTAGLGFSKYGTVFGKEMSQEQIFQENQEKAARLLMSEPQKPQA